MESERVIEWGRIGVGAVAAGLVEELQIDERARDKQQDQQHAGDGVAGV